MLNFSVTFKSGIPIYEQVVYAVKKAIVSGQLKSGDPFPSVRDISRELKINPNTVQKAINQLVQAKLLEIRPGIGSVVAELSQATEEQRFQILESEVEHLVIESKRLLIIKKDLIGAINKHWGGK
jgi:GntR family transcriptional regulator